MHYMTIQAMLAAVMASLLFSGLAFGHEPSCGNGLVLVYGGDGEKSEVSIHLGPKLTVVRRPEGVDVVDYEGLGLYRYNSSAKMCETYRLAAAALAVGAKTPLDPDDMVRREKARLLGSCRVENVDQAGKAQGAGPATWKRLAWGAETDRFRTAGKVSARMYGQLFEPETEEYLVSTAVERVDDLFCLAALREPVIKANPLLRRLDISGVSGLLRGVALEMVYEDGSSRTLKEIGAAEKLSLEQALPPACR